MRGSRPGDPPAVEPGSLWRDNYGLDRRVRVVRTFIQPMASPGEQVGALNRAQRVVEYQHAGALHRQRIQEFRQDFREEIQ